MDFKPMTEERPDRECLCLLRHLDPDGLAPGSFNFGPVWRYRTALWVPYDTELGDYGEVLSSWGPGWRDPEDEVEGWFDGNVDQDSGYEWTEWMELPQPAKHKV